MDELSVLTAIHQEQKRWRLTSKMIFIAILFASTFIFVVLSREVSGILIQVLMIISMFSIIGLVFLDRVSYQINKKLFKQGVLEEYLFKHSNPEDVHKGADVVVGLIKIRQEASQWKMKR